MSKDLDHKQLFDAMTAARMVVEPVSAGGFIVSDINKAALNVYKLQKDDVVGQALDNLFDDDALPFFVEALNESLQTKQSIAFKVLFVFPGAKTPEKFLISPIFDENKEIRYFDILAVEGTADESSLQRERDDAISLLTSVFDVSEVGIVVTDRHQRVVRVNESFLRIYGWSRDELVGKEFVDFMSPEERDLARHNHKKFLDSGIRSSGEMKVLRNDGNVANALFTTAALELSHGRRFQVTTIMDITLRKQMEMTLRLAKDQADSANHAKSTFLANMSHELRTPLNAIIGFSEMMMKETFGALANEKYREYLGDIHVSARHLLEIINEVLDMSKIEAGRVDLDEEYFDIGLLISAVNRMMDSRAFSSGLKMSEHVEEGLEPLYADSRLVRQILINLVGNAVKYSREGGTIDVSACLSEDGALHVVVADTGMGIPKDRIDEALEPFGQVNGPAEHVGIQGTGLGLPLAKAMVELHDGRLYLQSDAGEGTTVTVEFPSWRLGKQIDTDDSPLSYLRKRKGSPVN